MDAAIAGAVVGTMVKIVLFVGVITFFVSLCCWCHKKWRKRRSRAPLNVTTTSTVVHVPQPLPPAGYQPTYLPYQPVYFHPGPINMPMPPGAPPSYLEATAPSHAPFAAGLGPQMFPNHPAPMQSCSDEFVQKPYNPAYCPNV